MVHVTANFEEREVQLFNEFREASPFGELTKSQSLKFLSAFTLNLWKGENVTYGEILDGEFEKRTLTKDEYVIEIPEKMKPRIDQLIESNSSGNAQTDIESLLCSALKRGIASIYRDYRDAGFITEEKPFRRHGLLTGRN